MSKPTWYNEPNGTMGAAVLTSPRTWPPSKCFTVTSYPKPSSSQDWVLVKVRAAGLNRAELRGRNAEVPAKPELGVFADEYHEDPPKILGEEFVGTVEVAGANTSFKAGDKVAGWVYGGGKAHDGAYAEYTICRADRCFKLESDLPWDILGGVPMSMFTAWGSIFDAGETKPGQAVLVHGGTSSVGIWAILLAKDTGCRVIATTRQERKVEKLKKAGADHVLLESDHLLSAVLEIFPQGVDTVLELVGPDKIESFSLPALARHGTVVVTGVLTKAWSIKDFTPAIIPPTRKLTMFTPGPAEMAPARKVLQEVLKKVERGVFKPEVFLDKVFPLDKIGEAHEYMEENKAVGKVVVTI